MTTPNQANHLVCSFCGRHFLAKTKHPEGYCSAGCKDIAEQVNAKKEAKEGEEASNA